MRSQIRNDHWPIQGSAIHQEWIVQASGKDGDIVFPCDRYSIGARQPPDAICSGPKLDELELRIGGAGVGRLPCSELPLSGSAPCEPTDGLTFLKLYSSDIEPRRPVKCRKSIRIEQPSGKLQFRQSQHKQLRASLCCNKLKEAVRYRLRREPSRSARTAHRPR